LSLPVVFRPKVGRDLATAFNYYEAIQAGLGDAFLARVESTFDAIEHYPNMFSSVHGDVRRAIVNRFPYAVFYRTEPQQIVVFAVVHTARDPELWPRPGRK
jgi:plasmid stabilization system protein ParE